MWTDPYGFGGTMGRSKGLPVWSGIGRSGQAGPRHRQAWPMAMVWPGHVGRRHGQGRQAPLEACPYMAWPWHGHGMARAIGTGGLGSWQGHGRWVGKAGGHSGRPRQAGRPWPMGRHGHGRQAGRLWWAGRHGAMAKARARPGLGQARARARPGRPRRRPSGCRPWPWWQAAMASGQRPAGGLA